METVNLLGGGWMIALPILHVTGFILAFVAGGLLAGYLQASPRKGRPSPGYPAIDPVSQVPASLSAEVPAALPSPGGPGSCALDKGLVFGHEMRNYLCAIRGNARLLREGAPGKDQAAIIDRIDRVLEKLENFQWKEESAPDLLAPRIQETLDLAHAARTCSRLHFPHAIADFPCDNSEPPPFVQGDPHRLDQVFNNLYRNALEAGATRIVTRFRRIGNEVEIAIEDNGIGCPAETAKRIFEPFFSTKTGTGPYGEAAGNQGLPKRGLGLFIVQSIVENHRGRIRANSKNGRGDGESGLVVYLNFPIFLSNQVPAKDPENPAAGGARFPVASGA